MRIDRLHGFGRQSRARDRSLDDLDQHAVRALRRTAAAQQHRIPALEGERRDVDRHVGAGLVDRTHDAERNPHLAELDAVGQARAAHDRADRIGQGDDVAHGGGERTHSGVVESQPVDQSLGETPGAPALQVVGVRGDDARNGGLERRSDALEGGVLARRG